MARKLFHAFVNPAADVAGFTGTKPSNWNAALDYGDATGTGPSGDDAYVREVLSADRTYYVRTDGSDSNDGLTNSAGGAFLTLQKAFDTVITIDAASFAVTISIGAGTFSGGATGSTLSQPVLGLGTAVAGYPGYLSIVGADATGSTVLTHSGTGATGAVKTTAGGRIVVGNVQVAASSTGSALVAIDGGSIALSTGVRFGASVGDHCKAATNGTLYLDTSYAIVGGADNHISSVTSGYIQQFATTVTITGTPAFTIFAQCSDLGYIQSFVTYSGGATGTRYSVTLNGVTNTSGGGATYFPGSVAGSTATGGQYA